MKKTITVLLVCIFIAFALSACDLFAPFRPAPQPTDPAGTSAADVPTSAAPTEEPPVAPDPTDAPTETQTEAPAETPTEVVIGSLDNYVKTAKEATFTFDNGNVNTYRLPEILLGSSDAVSANKEIMDRFGDDCLGGRGYSPVISMDYEAYLCDRILSVVVTAKYDGGNSYGLCYAFDVTSGSRLNNEALCEAYGHDYNETVAALTANVTAGYDERYSQMGGNESQREKTLSESNIKAAKLYLNDSGQLTALVELYAAVGGGHWVDSFSAE